MAGRILAGAMADMPIINRPRLRYQWQPHKISIRRWINPYRNVTVDWIRLLYDDNGKLDWIRTFKTSTPIDFEAEDWNRYRVKFDNQKYVVSKIINWIEWFDWQEAMVGEFDGNENNDARFIKILKQKYIDKQPLSKESVTDHYIFTDK